MSAASSTAGAFPERVGKYELLLPLGTGGTATVYLARTRGVAGFEREVALKLVHAHLRADEESRLHLLEEARLAARIRHPNVVPVTEVDSDAVGVFLVMDYVEGEALSGLVRVLREQNHRLPPRLIARIMNDSLAGLHAAHELRDAQGQFIGLVHRDFSPQNILVGVEGVARLADFGVAKAASRTVRTKTGLVKGKVAYMSPEQARGHKVDRRCDVWAAGVVVWELITGRKLYDHEDDVATLLSVVTEEPPRLASVMQGVPPALDEAVAYALTSDVNNRCPSAEAFRCLLESAWDECGGMASTGELGAFVRQTVGHRLAERRALTARGRTTTSTGAASGSAPRSTAPAALPASAAEPARPPEDGTKTAISAAVPAAERVSAPRSTRFGRRSVGIAASASVLALALAGIGVAVSSPEPVRVQQLERPSATIRAAEVPPIVAVAVPQSEPAPPPVVATDTVIISDAPRADAARVGGGSRSSEADDSRADGEEAAPTNGGRRRYSSSRLRAQHKSKAKQSSRTGTTRLEKHSETEPRVLPLPQPSERQLRTKAAAMGQPAREPLNLAPDPYDPNR
ncbi:MAG TPA: protein kinase [Polyangiaceae bacterium]|nr:protein kinase [Polyangiaceae bacterium]